MISNILNATRYQCVASLHDRLPDRLFRNAGCGRVAPVEAAAGCRFHATDRIPGRTSVERDAADLDDLAPMFGFIAYVLGELRRVAASRFDALAQKVVAH